jgi:hypothetical protein
VTRSTHTPRPAGAGDLCRASVRRSRATNAHIVVSHYSREYDQLVGKQVVSV